MDGGVWMADDDKRVLGWCSRSIFKHRASASYYLSTESLRSIGAHRSSEVATEQNAALGKSIHCSNYTHPTCSSCKIRRDGVRAARLAFKLSIIRRCCSQNAVASPSAPSPVRRFVSIFRSSEQRRSNVLPRPSHSAFLLSRYMSHRPASPGRARTREWAFSKQRLWYGRICDRAAALLHSESECRTRRRFLSRCLCDSIIRLSAARQLSICRH